MPKHNRHGVPSRFMHVPADPELVRPYLHHPGHVINALEACIRWSEANHQTHREISMTYYDAIQLLKLAKAGFKGK